MSKRQEIRARRRREEIRNRILIISLVVVGVFLFVFVVFINPLLHKPTTPSVVSITPRVLNTKVDGVHLGDPNAPVKVDVYADFRCSGCLYYVNNIEPQVIQKYVETGKVYYGYHSYIVIDGHDGTDASLRSANAAMCANEQGRFWDYHDTLFANQITEDASLFTDARLVKMAENLKLDMTAFNQCYQAKKYASVVQQDIAQAQSFKITGTPSIIINGTLLSDFSQTTQGIDSALAGK